MISLRKNYIPLYCYIKKVFTQDECKIISSIKNKIELKKGVVKNQKEFQKIRKSDVYWLENNEEYSWVYDKINDCIQELNNKYFKFNIDSMEFIQFTNYKAPSGKYGKHIDCITDHVVRKLSFVVQITDPKKYKGGDLCLYDGEQPQKMNKDQGDFICFPSYVLHEVEPITKGERNSLVGWVGGENFK